MASVLTAKTPDLNVPEKQEAIVQTHYGSASEVLHLSKEHPVVKPGPHAILVRVEAASINPIDWQMIQGNRRLLVGRRFPFVPLFDLAGTVVEIGESVSRFKVDDSINGCNKLLGGGAAQYCSIDEGLAAHIPPNVSFTDAAAIPIAGQTALLCIERGGVVSGQRILVIGASGGVGAVVVQMAVANGAEVAGICSERNFGFVRSLGASTTIDYSSEDIVEQLGTHCWDVVVDCVGGLEQWIRAQKLLVSGGRFVTISRDEDGEVTVWSAVTMILSILSRQARSFFGRKIQYIPIFLDANWKLLEEVNSLLGKGTIEARVSKLWQGGLTDVIPALEFSKSGRTVGKAVIAMRPSP